MVAGLQGSRLTRGDQLVALKECGTSIQTSTFKAQPINASLDALTDLLFDFGHLGVEWLGAGRSATLLVPRGLQRAGRVSGVGNGPVRGVPSRT